MSKNYKHPFEVSRKEFKALVKKLPRAVSVIAKSEFNQNFKRQGYNTESGAFVKWQKRQKPFTESEQRRDKGRAILIQTGRLRRSIQIKPTANLARVVSDVPYAQIHNEGGKIKGRQRTLSTNRRTGKTRFRATSSPANMPARPFMVNSKQLMDEIEDYLFDELDKMFLK